MRLGFFLPAMIVGYLAFIEPGEFERGLAAVRSATSRLKRRALTLVADV